jgi:hypothetical protein
MSTAPVRPDTAIHAAIGEMRLPHWSRRAISRDFCETEALTFVNASQ